MPHQGNFAMRQCSPQQMLMGFRPPGVTLLCLQVQRVVRQVPESESEAGGISVIGGQRQRQACLCFSGIGKPMIMADRDAVFPGGLEHAQSRANAAVLKIEMEMIFRPDRVEPGQKWLNRLAP